MVRKTKQRGFTLIELLITTALATLAMIASVPMVIAKIEDAGMEGTGAYMAMVKTGLERYNLTNHDALADGTAQAAITPALGNAYAPTIAELVRDKYITGNSLTDITPQRQRVLTRITTPNCPGPDCAIFAIAYTTTPLVYTGTNEPRYDLLATFVSSEGASGTGLITKPGGNGAVLSGSSGLTTPNPLGPVNGILAIGSYLNESLYTNFVRRLDTRDPDLRGGLSVQGVSKDGVNTLNVAGPSSLNGTVGVNGDVTLKDATNVACIKLFANGQIDVNCTGQVNAKKINLPDQGSGTVQVGNTGVGNPSIQTTGLINAAKGFFAGLTQYVQGSLKVPANQQYGIDSGATRVVAVNDSGATESKGSFNSPYVTLSSQVTLGTACSVAVAPAIQTPGQYAVSGAPKSTIGSTAGGGIAYCANNVWTAIATPGTAGGACAPDGSTGIDQNGAALICQGGQFVTLSDRFGSLVFSESTTVANPGKDTAVVKGVPASPIVPNPICASGASAPRAYIIPNNETQANQKVNRYLQVVAGGWQVFMIDGNSVHIPEATATVQTYCTY